MKELILLGAGASVEAGVPAAYKMTERLVELFGEKHKHSHVLRFVVGGLLMKEGVAGGNPFGGVNVEDVFNAIQLLARRESLEASPFIGSWHPLIDQLDTITPSVLNSFGRSSVELNVGNRVDRALKDLVAGKKFGASVGSIIQEAITGRSRSSNLIGSGSSRKNGPQPGHGRIFEETSQRMIQKLVEMVWIKEAKKVDYLSKLAKCAIESCSTIATLNYDNAIELSAYSLGHTLNTGIESWSKTGGFPSDANATYLLKLHGSIDWALDPSSPSDEKPLKHSILRKVQSADIEKAGFYPAVIFGQKNKLTAKGPFLDLLRVFREKLHAADLLTVVGYSFRDDHIMSTLGTGLTTLKIGKLEQLMGLALK